MLELSAAKKQLISAFDEFAPEEDFKFRSLRKLDLKPDYWVFRCRIASQKGSYICKIGKNNEWGRKKTHKEANHIEKIQSVFSDPRFRVPKLHRHVENASALILEDAKAQSLNVAFKNSSTLEDIHVLLAGAGKPLSFLHKHHAELRSFDPSHNLNYISGQIQNHKDGKLKIPDFEHFEKLKSDLIKHAQLAKNHRTKHCQIHGDYHLGNLIRAKNGALYLVDFADSRNDYAIDDIFLMISKMLMIWPLENFSFEMIKEIAQNILIQSKLQATPSEVLDYFQLYAAMRLWSTLKEPEGFSLNFERRFYFLKLLTEIKLFSGGSYS